MLEAYLLLCNIINAESPLLQKEKLFKDHTLAAQNMAYILSRLTLSSF